MNRLGDSGVNRLGDTSAFVNPAGQLLLTRRGETRMDGVGIVAYLNSIQPLFNTSILNELAFIREKKEIRQNKFDIMNNITLGTVQGQIQ